jgi:hypothetical protein
VGEEVDKLIDEYNKIEENTWEQIQTKQVLLAKIEIAARNSVIRESEGVKKKMGEKFLQDVKIEHDRLAATEPAALAFEPESSLLKRIWRIAEENREGFTRYIYGLTKPSLKPAKMAIEWKSRKEGWEEGKKEEELNKANAYCVAYPETQNFFGWSGLKQAFNIAMNQSEIIGGWFHKGKYYFDSVRIYQTKAAAVEASIRQDQIGYYAVRGGYKEIRDSETMKLYPEYTRLGKKYGKE